MVRSIYFPQTGVCTSQNREQAMMLLELLYYRPRTPSLLHSTVQLVFLSIRYYLPRGGSSHSYCTYMHECCVGLKILRFNVSTPRSTSESYPPSRNRRPSSTKPAC